MIIGGLQKLTLLDYPEKLACVVFVKGCNFCCQWCYSPELVLSKEMEKQPSLKEEEVLDFLSKRVNKIDGVVICGGEPTCSSGLLDFIVKVREKGFLIKLDTNGSFPETIESLLQQKMIDYLAMDVKQALTEEKYYQATGVKVNIEKIKESINIITNSGIDYEFRTTVVPTLHQKGDVSSIAKEIKGAKKYYLQNFYPQKTINKEFLKIKPFNIKQMEEFQKEAQPFVKMCHLR